MRDLPLATKAVAVAVLSTVGLFLLSADDSLNDFGLNLFRSLGRYNRAGRQPRVALVRPISTGGGQSLLESFDLWDTHWPCTGANMPYVVDLFISYSQTLDAEAHPDDVEAIELIKSKYNAHEGWNGCLSRFSVIEVNMDPYMDKYNRSDEQTDPMWVNGPNEQFRRSIREIMKKTKKVVNGDQEEVEPEYEIAFIMETDAKPANWGWMNSLLQDFEVKEPFAILGR